MVLGRGSLAIPGGRKCRLEFPDWKTGGKESLRFFQIKEPFENERGVMYFS